MASPIRANGSGRSTAIARRSRSRQPPPRAPSPRYASRSTPPPRSPTMRAEWKVLVADDEPAARRGVRQLLAPFPDFAVVGECRNGAEVLASFDTLKPDVIFLDV